MENRTFDAAVKGNALLEDKAGKMFEATLDLAKEIAERGSKDPLSLTETEKKFIKAVIMFSISGVLHGKAGVI